jgi:predicted lipid-binding transport protein (Tim44 family)
MTGVALGAAILISACTTSPAGTAAKPASAPPAQASPATAQAAVPAAPTRVKAPGVATSQEAVRELVATRKAYEEAQQAFAAGDRQKALDLMNTAYLDHFERVEPWMDQKIGKEYREQVESTISRDLRRKLRDDLKADVAAQFPVGLKALQDAETRAAAQP